MNCYGKQNYPNRPTAEASLIRVRQMFAGRQRGRIPTSVYSCHDCGAWHLTHVPPERVRTQEERQFKRAMTRGYNEAYSSGFRNQPRLAHNPATGQEEGR